MAMLVLVDGTRVMRVTLVIEYLEEEIPSRAT